MAEIKKGRGALRRQMRRIETKLAAGGEPIAVMTHDGPATARQANVTYTEMLAFVEQAGEWTQIVARSAKSFDDIRRLAGKQPAAQVPCNGCTACCYHMIDVTPEEAVGLETERHQHGLMLKRREDGGCLYLAEDGGCSIYNRRPAACRIYDCRIPALWGVSVKHTEEVREPLWKFDVESAEDAAIQAAIHVALEETRGKTRHSEETVQRVINRFYQIIDEVRVECRKLADERPAS